MAESVNVELSETEMEQHQETNAFWTAYSTITTMMQEATIEDSEALIVNLMNVHCEQGKDREEFAMIFAKLYERVVKHFGDTMDLVNNEDDIDTFVKKKKRKSSKFVVDSEDGLDPNKGVENASQVIGLMPKLPPPDTLRGLVKEQTIQDVVIAFENCVNDLLNDKTSSFSKHRICIAASTLAKGLTEQNLIHFQDTIRSQIRLGRVGTLSQFLMQPVQPRANAPLEEIVRNCGENFRAFQSNSLVNIAALYRSKLALMHMYNGFQYLKAEKNRFYDEFKKSNLAKTRGVDYCSWITQLIATEIFGEDQVEAYITQQKMEKKSTLLYPLIGGYMDEGNFFSAVAKYLGGESALLFLDLKSCQTLAIGPKAWRAVLRKMSETLPGISEFGPALSRVGQWMLGNGQPPPTRMQLLGADATSMENMPLLDLFADAKVDATIPDHLDQKLPPIPSESYNVVQKKMEVEITSSKADED